jgi:hypothetical protein
MSQVNVTAPRLPNATKEYDANAMDQFFAILRRYFTQLDNRGPIAAASQFQGTAVIAGLSFPPNPGSTTPSLPTQANLANLRVGDVYYDTTAGNVLKVKV